MLREHEAQYGVKRLTFTAFFEHYGFPLYLYAEKLPKVLKNNPPHRWFTDFGRRTFTKRYLALREQAPEDWPQMGLVFFWPFLGNKRGFEEAATGLVLHNWVRSDMLPGTQVSWVCPESGEQLILEAFPRLLSAVDADAGGRWSPDE